MNNSRTRRNPDPTVYFPIVCNTIKMMKILQSLNIPDYEQTTFIDGYQCVLLYFIDILFNFLAIRKNCRSLRPSYLCLRVPAMNSTLLGNRVPNGETERSRKSVGRFQKRVRLCWVFHEAENRNSVCLSDLNEWRCYIFKPMSEEKTDGVTIFF